MLLTCLATSTNAQTPQSTNPPGPRSFHLKIENPFKRTAKEATFPAEPQKPSVAEPAPAVHTTHWGVAEPNPAVEAIPPNMRDFQRTIQHKASYQDMVELKEPANPSGGPKLLDPFRNWWKGSSRTQSLFTSSAGSRPAANQPRVAEQPNTSPRPRPYVERFQDEPPAAQTAQAGNPDNPSVLVRPPSVSNFRPIVIPGDRNGPAKIKYVEVRP